MILEIQSVAEQLDPKHKYLAEAPAKDPDGNPGVLRYSRKAKEQYVMSEIDGKATGWMAFYRDGKWVEEQTKKKAPAKKKRQPRRRPRPRKRPLPRNPDRFTCWSYARIANLLAKTLVFAMRA